MKKLLVASVISAFFALPAMADQKADIVVIGAGGAGLTAAVTAHDLNKNVVVVEKMGYVGGNTNRAAGGMNAAESKPQAKLGIKDSVQSMYDDTMKGGHNINNPELVHTLADNARYSIDFLNGLGGDFNDVGMMAGASQKRAHRPTGGDFVGAEIVKTLKKASDERKIPIMMNTKVDKILINDTGKVVGVEVIGKDGKVEKIDAGAVIIASGGFGANEDMLAALNPSLKGFGTTNHPGATGDGIKLGQTVGADVVDMKEIQTHPTVVPGNGEMITEAVRGNGAILVNQDGKRFVNELDTRDVVSEKTLDQKGKYAYLIFDQDVRKSLKAIESYVKNGLTTEAETLSELAKKLDMSADNLEQTIDHYAKDQAAGKDTEFGRADMPRPVNKGPFYAVKVLPAVHHTMGGLKINKETEVLDKNGKPIPGLYAAGEVTGGIHGANRLGGNSTADIVTFGRIAGKNAAEHCK